MVEVQNSFVLLGITKKYKAKLTFFALLRLPLMSYISLGKNVFSSPLTFLL